MTDLEWTIYDFGRKKKWCAVLELGKEKQVFCDLKPWENKMFWVILGFIWLPIHKDKVLCCFIISIKTRALAVLTDIL